ncbi:Arc family DNA-binding protein [Erythrobacter vulgaris]|uniref:Arc family DNA-binding protein n=1 Tax=Qipengyuania vulgaris TaxID=291985 RepID=A0A844XUV7_9SPHN|nr:Arc family DNA-binding protein [Qipengyuania vulgaris]MXO48923.1 Arc family DNA-binding protein [Qipengyuania vulgaris]
MTAKRTKDRDANDVVGLQLRFREDLRSRLADAARANARSLNAEIVQRLESSIEQEDRAFGPQTVALLQSISDELDRISRITGKDWFNDAETNRASSLLVRDLVRAKYVPDTSYLEALVDLNRKKLPNRERAEALIQELSYCRVITSVKSNLASNAKLEVTELPENRWRSEDYDALRFDLGDDERENLRQKLGELKALLIVLNDLNSEEEEILRPQREAAKRGEALYAAIMAAARPDSDSGP